VDKFRACCFFLGQGYLWAYQSPQGLDGVGIITAVIKPDKHVVELMSPGLATISITSSTDHRKLTDSTIVQFSAALLLSGTLSLLSSLS
jgi:hypothetical protein